METNDDINEILAAIDVPIGDPLFFQRAFTLMAKRRKQAWIKDPDNFKRVAAEEYDDLSRRLDKTKIQESCSVRNVLRTRRLANLLIDDKGELIVSLIPHVIKHLKSHLYSLGPNRQYDAERQEQILAVLNNLQTDKELVIALKQISAPHGHKYAEQIIRETLQLPANTMITDAHARRAALSALLCYLRQSVGSCFATAPAIIVQTQQPILFLKDINELLSTGRLKRTFGGIEYSVPLSASWGVGDLRKLFIVEKRKEGDQMDLWLSPGMIAALEAANLFDSEVSINEKVNYAKELILNAILSWEGRQAEILMSAEALLRHILLTHLKLTEQDLEDYENRPRGMIHSSLLMQVAQPATGGGKTQACSNFYILFEQATNAFKALADNALLKAWEFTIASFAETKAQFTRWNLYSSLGLRPEEKGGIGHSMYEVIKHKLEQANEKVRQIQFEYEQVFTQVKYLESRMRTASTEQELKWIKVEYQVKANEFHTLEEVRNNENDKAKRIASLFDLMIDTYDRMFPQYFQEVYDADMHDIKGSIYDDSPAGFRLLYKHGRSNTSQWTRIKTPNEFVEMLASFFIATETEINSLPDLEGLQQDVSEVVTAVVNQVRSVEFLETAFHRMAIAHNTRPIKDPLKHLDMIDKKPWAYTSGGTMGTLVSCYYRREQKPTEVGRWVESSAELLVFIVDALKQISYKTMEEYIANPQKAMLMHSPTHAFLLKPGQSPLKEAWNTDAYTYTWIRDNLIKPMEQANENILLDEEKTHYLIEELATQVPPNFRHYYRKTFTHIHGTLTPREFRHHVIHTINHERGLQHSGRAVLTPEDVDSVLFRLLPIFPAYQLRERLEKIVEVLAGMSRPLRERIVKMLDDIPNMPKQQLMDAQRLQDSAKALLCLASGDTSSEQDYHLLISQAAQKLGYALQAPILFADTNWVKDKFGFVVNPGNGHFELWRIDYTGRVGSPMYGWEQWLDGSRQDISWGIYTRPYEYSS